MTTTTVTPTRKWERQHWQQGRLRAAGVDEVGRGALAGPVTVAAVLLPVRCRLPAVRDSKLLSAPQRQQCAVAIRRVALAIGIGWASSSEIDQLGLTAAMRLAGSRALTHLGGYEILLLDGTHNYFGDDYQVSVAARADQTCLAVAAASVVAKVARDRYMELLDRRYPHYQWARNKGYGSAAHLAALAQHGPAPAHRRSYAPVQRQHQRRHHVHG